MATTTDNVTAASAIDGTPTGNPSVSAQDPFANQRETGNDPFSGDTDKLANTANGAGAGAVDESAIDDAERTNSNSLSPPLSPNSPRDRRMSREWDAAKVPPSQFQKRKGSIYSTPGSRDSHHENKERDKAYHEKLKEKGWKILGKK